MVCLACLLPLFLIPVINALPLLFHFILGKVYRLFGWEYIQPQRVPPACPYKPAANKVTPIKEEEASITPPAVPEAVAANDDKRD